MNEETRALYAAIGRGETVQFKYHEGDWTDWTFEHANPGHAMFSWRIKPRMIRVNGVEVPAPLDALPESGYIYAPDHLSAGFIESWYFNCPGARLALERGIAHATRESAIAHAKAMLIRELSMSAPMSFEAWKLSYAQNNNGLTPSANEEVAFDMGEQSRLPEIDALKAELAKAREALDIAFAKGVQSALADKAQFKARIAELERECVALAANQCLHKEGIIGSDGGTPLCPITCTPDADAAIAAMKGQS